jgi:tight adherence protein B
MMSNAALYALIVVAVLTSVEAFILLLSRSTTARRRRVRERLSLHANRMSQSEGSGILLADPDDGSWLDQITSRLPKRRSVQLLLYRSGANIGITELMAACIALAIGGLVAGVLALNSLAIGLALAPLGLLPIVVLVARQRKRMKRFEAQLPEALDLICRALRAGISLEYGFRSVGEELADPVGPEFAVVAQEMSLGLDLRIALVNMATRTNVSDMPFLVNAILIQRETGGNLAEILENLSRVIRERTKFYGKVRSLLAQARLQADLLALVPAFTVVAFSLFAPTYLEPLWRKPGIYVLYAACLLVPTGWLICRRIGSIRA